MGGASERAGEKNGTPKLRSIDWQASTSNPAVSLERGESMHDLHEIKPLRLRGVAIIAATIGAVAIGAVAIGAVAIGAFAIGRLTIGRIAVKNAEFDSLKIRDLTVTRLHVAEITGSDSLQLP